MTLVFILLDVSSAEVKEVIVKDKTSLAKRYFNKSDVFGSLGDPDLRFKLYKQFSVNYVPWGGYPLPGQNWFKTFVQKAKSNGTKIGGKIGTKTDFENFIDFAPHDYSASLCRKIDGSPLLADDMGNISLKGYPSYWFCTNSPKYRDFLKRNIRQAVESGVFGMMMDDPLGTLEAAYWNEHDGCYCDFCMKGFKEFVKRKYNSTELQKVGISDIDGHDLKAHFQKYKMLPPNKRPLYKEYLDYQFESSAEMFSDVMNYAIALAGQKFPISGNIQPFNPVFGSLLLKADYYACECRMGAETGSLSSSLSLFAYKVADSLERPVVIQGYGTDHAFVQKNRLPGMVRSWIVEAYANGNYFMAPYKLWAYSSEKKVHFYRPDNMTEVASLYQFIKTHSVYFDNYSDVSRIGVVLSWDSYSQNSENARKMVRKMADLNIPFHLIVVGNCSLRQHVKEEQLKGYDYLILPENTILDQEDEKTIKKYGQHGHIISDYSDLEDTTYMISITGTNNVHVSLRAVKEDSSRPFILHLLNRDYVLSTDSVINKKDFHIILSKKLIGNYNINDIKLIQPASLSPKKIDSSSRELFEHETINLTFKVTGDIIEITVPALDVWGILVLSHVGTNK